MKTTPAHTASFGPYVLDLRSGELRKYGVRVKIGEQPFQILLMLLDRPGEMVTREELRGKLWADETFVDFDHSLNSAVKRLRDCLSDTAEKPVWVETIPRRGYRFIAPVETQTIPFSQALEKTAPALSPSENDSVRFAEPSQSYVLRALATRWGFPTATALVVIAAIALVLNVGNLRGRLTMGSSASNVRSLAVLPFVNASKDPNIEYISDGLAETLIDKLSQIPNLRVMSRAATFGYKDTDVDPRQAGRNLQVAAILGGKITKYGDTLRIHADLVNVSDGAELWGQDYSRPISEVLAVESDIAREITEKLRIPLTGGEATRMPRRDTDNPEAYEAFLKGEFETSKKTRDGLLKGADYFAQAVKLDPNYVWAYDGLYWNYAFSADLISPPRDVMPKAKAAAERLLQIDDGLGLAHSDMAMVSFTYDYDFPAADKELKRAMEIAPVHTYSYEQYGIFLAAMRRSNESAAAAEQAQRLDPLSSEVNLFLGETLYFLHRYDRAINELRNAIELDRAVWITYVYLGWCYEAQDKLPQAIAEFQKARKITDSTALPPAAIARSYALQGNKAGAREILRQLKGVSQHNYVSPYATAAIYAALGEKDKAIELLDEAYEERSRFVPFLAVDPKFDSLRSDPRFQDLIHRVGIPQ
jgi:TolB-like protein/DNA-binding winged helix-turn-helix (wHTH) protein/tetratricopeptide (TPR) repeat protein